MDVKIVAITLTVSNNLNICIPYDSANPLLVIQTEIKICVQQKSIYLSYCNITLHSLKLDTIQIPITVEWIYKLWFIYGIEYFITLEINKPASATFRMNLRNIMLSETNHKQRRTYCIILLV